MSRQLHQTLIRNSFNIFGLSTSSTLKEIRKRYQQLLQLAKIEEIEEFDTDVGNIREFRNADEIRFALERISGIKDRLIEIFFWFDDHNKENQKAITLISRENYDEAINIFNKADKSSLDWLGYKNLALALLFKAFYFDNIKDFARSCELWKSIVESEDFWKFYEKHYLLHDELGTSSLLFKEFRNEIYDYLSEKAIAFYDQIQNPEVIGIYYSTFDQLSKSIDSEVIQPIVHKIKKEISELGKVDIESDIEGEDLRKSLKKINKYFMELNKFKLSEYSPLNILRNDSSEKLRSVAVDIYNKNDDSELAKLLLDQCSMIAVSGALVSKIESDKEHIEDAAEYELWGTISSRFDKIKELISEGKIIKARDMYLNLDSELKSNDSNPTNSVRSLLLVGFCSEFTDKGHEIFAKRIFGIRTYIDCLLYWKNQRDAVYIFANAYEILMDRICLLNIVYPSGNSTTFTDTVVGISNALKTSEITSLIDYHETYMSPIDEMVDIQNEVKTQSFLRLLSAAVYYSVFYNRVRKISQKSVLKSIGIWGTILAFVFLIDYRSKSLTDEEHKAIEYLQTHKPDVLNMIRKKGYSDKKIARYMIEHADDDEEQQ